MYRVDSKTFATVMVKPVAAGSLDRDIQTVSMSASHNDPGTGDDKFVLLRPPERGTDSETISFRMPVESARFFDELVRQAGLSSRADLFRRALQTYAVMWEAVAEGGQVFIRDADGHVRRLPIGEGRL